MKALGARLLPLLSVGRMVLLFGELGAGKTTLVRGLLSAAGWEGAVRSPTFNLMQVYETDPPILHADLYRLKSAAGIGLEDYLETHICLIEWPDRLDEVPEDVVVVRIDFDGEGRLVEVSGLSEPIPGAL